MTAQSDAPKAQPRKAPEAALAGVSAPGSGATARLADYVALVPNGGGAGALPEGVRREAVRAFVNIVGCVLGGAKAECVAVTWAALSPFQGPAQATLSQPMKSL